MDKCSAVLLIVAVVSFANISEGLVLVGPVVQLIHWWQPMTTRLYLGFKGYTAYSISSYQCHLKRQIWMVLRHCCKIAHILGCFTDQTNHWISGSEPPRGSVGKCRERCMEPWHVSPWAESSRAQQLRCVVPATNRSSPMWRSSSRAQQGPAGPSGMLGPWAGQQAGQQPHKLTINIH